MEINKQKDYAFFVLDVVGEKKEDIFPVNGKIGKIRFEVKSNDSKDIKGMKLTIGGLVLTYIDFLPHISVYGKTTAFEFHNSVIFKKGDILKFEQENDNTSEVVLLFSELETEKYNPPPTKLKNETRKRRL